jgi:hypothetical protein
MKKWCPLEGRVFSSMLCRKQNPEDFLSSQCEQWAVAATDADVNAVQSWIIMIYVTALC